jgi:hypothetical protein
MELVIEELSDQTSVTFRVKNHKHYVWQDIMILLSLFQKFLEE